VTGLRNPERKEWRMSYCKRMNRPCTCGRLFIYNRKGIVEEPDNGANCLTDSEVQSATSLLLDEWRRRFNGNEVGPARLYA
jgi:hypothetical protein